MSFPLSVVCLVALILALLSLSWNSFTQGKDLVEIKKKLNLETKNRKQHIIGYLFWLLSGFVIFGLIILVLIILINKY